MDLLFTITNQELERTDTSLVVADSIDYLYAAFTFSSDWNGTSKIAVFTKLLTKTSYSVALVTDRCLVPWEVLQGHGDFSVSVYAGSRITANVVIVNVSPSGLPAYSAPQGASPTFLQDLIDSLDTERETLQNLINDINDMLEGGDLKGDPGEPGSSGASAYEYAVAGGYTGTEEDFTELLGSLGDITAALEYILLGGD